MKKKYKYQESKGLPGGPNEMFTYATGVFDIYQAPSNIEGEGMFAGKPFKKGDLIGLAHSNNQPASQLGRMHNHDENSPTMISKKSGGDRFVFAAKDLQPGDELTTNYRMQPELEQPEDFQYGGSIMAPPRKGVRKNADGSESTHLMATETFDGKNWFSFPTLFQNPDGTWIDMSDRPWQEAYEEAKRRGEVIEFGTDKEAAIKFGEGSWKLPKAQEGNGETPLTRDEIFNIPRTVRYENSNMVLQDKPIWDGMLDEVTITPTTASEYAWQENRANQSTGGLEPIYPIFDLMSSGLRAPLTKGAKAVQGALTSEKTLGALARSPYVPKFTKPGLIKNYKSKFPNVDLRGTGTGNYNKLGVNELGLGVDDFGSLTNYERSAISQVNQTQPADEVFNTFVQRYADFNTDNALANQLADFSRRNPRTKFEINLGRDVTPSKRMQEIFNDPELNVHDVFSYESSGPMNPINKWGHQDRLFYDASARNPVGEFEKNLRSYGQQGFYAANVPMGKPVKQALTYNKDGRVFDYVTETLPVSDFVVNKGLMNPDVIGNFSRYRGAGDMANQHNFLLGITNSPSVIISGNKGFAGLKGGNKIREKIGGLITPTGGKAVPSHNTQVVPLLKQEFNLSKPFEGTFIKSPSILETYYNSRGQASPYTNFPGILDIDDLFIKQKGGEPPNNSNLYPVNAQGIPMDMLDEVTVTGDKFKEKWWSPANLATFGLLNEAKRRLTKNINPFGYDGLDNLTNALFYPNREIDLGGTDPEKYPELVGKTEAEIKRERIQKHSGKPGISPLMERQQLFQYMMGQDASQYDGIPLSGEGYGLRTSKYKPTKASDPNTHYFSSPTTEYQIKNKIQQIVNNENKSFSSGDVSKYELGSVLGNYHLSKGEDDKGKYISYYDIWDLDPFYPDHKYTAPSDLPLIGGMDISGNILHNLSDKFQQLGNVTPAELYGRVYYTENPDGTINVLDEKKYGGSLPQYQTKGEVPLTRNEIFNVPRTMAYEDGKMVVQDKPVWDGFLDEVTVTPYTQSEILWDERQLATGGLDPVYPVFDILSLGLKTPFTAGAKALQTGVRKAPSVINPRYFKPNSNMYYRGLGKEGMEDALQSGVFRAKPADQIPARMVDLGAGKVDLAKRFSKTYYTPHLKVADHYGNGFIAEVPRDAAQFSQRYRGADWSMMTKEQIPISQGQLLEKNWWSGYKPVKQNGGQLAKAQNGNGETHTVASGETFYGIANKYKLDKQDLMDANPGLNIESIKAGQTINLPVIEKMEPVIISAADSKREPTSWTDYINPYNWGVTDRDDDGTFNQAFRAARNAGEDEFMWYGTRYNTELAETPQIKEEEVVEEPKVEPLNFEGVKRAIKRVESIDGKLMWNPESTATGFYGQRFSEIENEYPGTRKDFAKDTVAQNEYFKRRFYDGLPASETTPLEKDANDLYEEYKPQIENFNFSKNDIAVLSNFLGRGGTRNYFGYHLRDGKPLEEVLPKIYGPGAKQKNKTPEEYLKEARQFYQTGGEQNQLQIYKDYIEGVYDGTEMEKSAEKIYDKLNRVYYSEAKKQGMKVPNYIMTNVIKQIDN